MALQAFSFKTKDIEDAMTNTLLHGGDLHSALDWLCLNLSDGKQYCHKILSVSKTFWNNFNICDTCISFWHVLKIFSLIIIFRMFLLFSTLFSIFSRGCSLCKQKLFLCVLFSVVNSHLTVHLIQQILKVCL